MVDRVIRSLLNEAVVPFWMWNDLLERPVLISQLKAIKDKGMNQVIIHARYGLKTPFLSDQWFDAVAWVIDAAIELDIGLWFYDELNWPSGYAGGKVLATFPEYRATHLNYTANGLEIRRSNWHPAYSDEFYIDVLNPKAVDAFIHFAYEGYWSRFSEHFGGSIRGFFTDEPGFYNNIEGVDPGTIPWSDSLPEYFQEMKGYSIEPHLMALWSGEDHESIQVRIDYWDVVSNLYQEAFFKKISDWCHQRNVALIGHVLFEESLVNTAKSQGNFFSTMKYLDVAGYDVIAGMRPETIIAARLADSARKLHHLAGVSCETFGMFGRDLTLDDMEQVVSWQIRQGLDVVILHALYYSLRGNRKNDCPPSFFEEPYWENLTGFISHVRTLKGSTQKAPSSVAIYYPIESVWGHLQINNPEKAIDIDNIFRLVSLACQNLGIQFDYVNDKAVANNYLSVYQYLILPQTEILAMGTLKVLATFIRKGGRVIVVGKPPNKATIPNQQENFESAIDQISDQFHYLGVSKTPRVQRILKTVFGKAIQLGRQTLPLSLLAKARSIAKRIGWFSENNFNELTGLEGQLSRLLNERVDMY